MAKAGRVQREETEGLHQGEHAAIAEAERRRALRVDDDGLGQGVEVVVADQAVVAQIFDAQQASVGGKADLPQGGEIVKSPTDLEVVGVVDRGFGPERLVFFVVLLDAGFFVVDVERGDDAFGQNPRAEYARGLPRDAAIENELHLIGPAEVEILAHDFFEQMAARARPIENLGQGEFGLEDRELIAIARRSAARCRCAASAPPGDRTDVRCGVPARTRERTRSRGTCPRAARRDTVRNPMVVASRNPPNATSPVAIHRESSYATVAPWTAANPIQIAAIVIV